jgi:hypothetical protein
MHLRFKSLDFNQYSAEFVLKKIKSSLLLDSRSTSKGALFSGLSTWGSSRPRGESLPPPPLPNALSWAMTTPRDNDNEEAARDILKRTRTAAVGEEGPQDRNSNPNFEFIPSETVDEDFCDDIEDLICWNKGGWKAFDTFLHAKS